MAGKIFPVLKYFLRFPKGFSVEGENLKIVKLRGKIERSGTEKIFASAISQCFGRKMSVHHLTTESPVLFS
jgi:hypothetical protein